MMRRFRHAIAGDGRWEAVRLLMRSLACSVGIALALGATAFASAEGQGRPQGNGDVRPGGVSLGVLVVPDTVTVGDPFRVVVRVRAPRGTTLEFPSAPDSGTGVEALDPVVVVPAGDTSAVEQTATYRLAAWDLGARGIRFPDILVREGATVRRLAVARRLSVFVASVLPADSTERVPKPPRPLFEFGPPWWWWALVALAALGVFGAVWWLWRRRRQAPPVAIRSPKELADAEFARIEAMELVASGERGAHVALMVDVVRDYLARVLPPAAPSLTTAELLQRLRGDTRLPLARLARLLQDVDLVKFAGAPIDAARAELAGDEARGVVDEVHLALQRAERREAA